jgi:hypothetical protein
MSDDGVDTVAEYVDWKMTMSPTILLCRPNLLQVKVHDLHVTWLQFCSQSQTLRLPDIAAARSALHRTYGEYCTFSRNELQLTSFVSPMLL